MINLANRLELFVDRHLIEDMEGTRLKLAEPKSAGVAIKFDSPFDGPHPYYVSVTRDSDVCKMWWRGTDPEKAGEIGIKDGFTHEWTCYAESRDGGITWVRPNLGLYEIKGTRQNNVVLAEDPPFSSEFMPFLDTKPGVPESERYKATVGMGKNMNCFRKGWLPVEKSGIHGFVSPDGIRWKKLRKERIFDDETRVFDGMNQAFWSEHENCYVMYYRQHTVADTEALVTTDKHRREYAKTVARTTSPDFVNWSGRHMLDWGGRAPTHLECIYTNGIRPYFRAPHIYIGLGSRFMQHRSVLTDAQCAPLDDAREAAGWQNPRKWWQAEGGTSWLKEDCNDGIFMTTRGGDKIDRTFCEAFVRPGIGYQNWTSRTNYMTLGVLQTSPTELSLYVLRRYAQVDPFLERMTIRLDGFSSLNAPYDGGEMLTKPFTFTGKELVLNYATSACGFVRVEIQEDNPAHELADPEPPGKPIAGFTLDECPEIIGDEIERVVTWKTGADVSRLSGKPVRLRFVMKDVDIYSLRFR